MASKRGVKDSSANPEAGRTTTPTTDNSVVEEPEVEETDEESGEDEEGDE